MNILLVLVPISVLLLGAAIWAFAWAVRRGQFDSLDSAALDVLTEDPGPNAGQADDAGAAAQDRRARPPGAGQ